MRKSKNGYFYHILVSPGDTPGAITLNVVWEREFGAYKLSCSMYPSIFNSFPVIRTASAKNRRFHVPQPTFLFPLETPLRLSRNMLYGWKENSMLTNCPAACAHLSITISETSVLPAAVVLAHGQPPVWCWTSLVRRRHWETEHLPSPDRVSETAFLLPSVIRHCRC